MSCYFWTACKIYSKFLHLKPSSDRSINLKIQFRCVCVTNYRKAKNSTKTFKKDTLEVRILSTINKNQYQRFGAPSVLNHPQSSSINNVIEGKFLI